MQTLAVANHKGGCGKTTTAVSLAAAFAKQGYRVLLVDFDPQAHATVGVGHYSRSNALTIYDVLSNPSLPLARVISQTATKGLDVVPSNAMLGAAELDLRGSVGKELVLGEKLRAVGDGYDFCFIDCAPNAGLLMINALVASNAVIIPVQAHYYALQGLRQMVETVRLLRTRFSPCTVEMLGLVVTFMDERTSLSKRIERGMAQYFGDLVFQSVIHSTVSLAEAPSQGETIFDFAPQSRGAKEYLALAGEVLQRLTARAETSENSGQADPVAV